MWRRWGEIGQWAGMAAAIAGLAVEIATRAEVGYAILTAGSLAWGIGTKVKYYRGAKGKRDATRYRLR
jgi:hypothetical protein